MVILIQNGEVFTPASIGKADLLIAGDLIQKVGAVDALAVRLRTQQALAICWRDACFYLTREFTGGQLYGAGELCFCGTVCAAAFERTRLSLTTCSAGS